MKITEILQDPDRMQQIMEMASSLGLQPSAEIVEFLPQNEIIQRISQIYQETETQESRQKTLIQALIPYLSPGRKLRLERAIQLSHLSRLAEAAFRSPYHPPESKEVAHV